MSANLDDLFVPDDQNTSKDKIDIENGQLEIAHTNDINNCSQNSQSSQNGDHNPNDSDASEDYALSGLSPDEQVNQKI